MKPFWKSVTFWSLVATLVGLALAGIGQGKTVGDLLADDIVRETIGEVLAAMGLAGVAWGRARAQGPLSLGRTDDERGNVRVAALGLLLLPLGLLLAAIIASGCGPRMVTAERSVNLDVWPGPPCLIRVEVDGELVARVDWTKRCDVGAPPATGAGEVTP